MKELEHRREWAKCQPAICSWLQSSLKLAVTLEEAWRVDEQPDAVVDEAASKRRIPSAFAPAIPQRNPTAATTALKVFCDSKIKVFF